MDSPGHALFLAMRVSAALACYGPALAAGYILSTEPVDCRAGPGHDFALLRTYAAREDVPISCQTIGVRSSIWHKSADGCYVAHKDIRSNDVAISRCDDAGTEFFPADEL
ncbi:hypothetical protein K4F52_009121 [Lecanicillium sp. MT-2017a]|nr:hypothetical protein K4F52_009121 [Lecanicillium sp. MT-2017a]